MCSIVIRPRRLCRLPLDRDRTVPRRMTTIPPARFRRRRLTLALRRGMSDCSLQPRTISDTRGKCHAGQSGERGQIFKSGLQLGRRLPARGPAHRRRADDPRHGAGVLPVEARPAGDRGLRPGDDRPRDLHRDGRARPAWRDDPRKVRLRRRQLRRLRPRRPRGRACRQRLPLDELGAVLAGDVPDLCLRLGSAAHEIPAQARHRRVGRLFRPDRARRRLRSGRHEDAGGERSPTAIGFPAPRCGSRIRRSPTCS